MKCIDCGTEQLWVTQPTVEDAALKGSGENWQPVSTCPKCFPERVLKYGDSTHEPVARRFLRERKTRD